MTVYVAHEFLESFFCMEDFLLCFSFFIGALVCEGDGYSRVEVSQLSHALGDDLVFVCGGCEDAGIWPELLACSLKGRFSYHFHWV